MNHPMTYPKDWVALLLILCSAIISISLLSACAGSGEGLVDTRTASASQTTRFSSTNTPYPKSTNTLNGKDDFNTRVAHFDATIAAQAALSPHPTPPQGPVYLESPIPTATWATGYFGGLDRANTFSPEYISCWNGYLSGNPLEICAGHAQAGGEYGGDPQQGVLRLKVYEQDQTTIVSDDVYETLGAFGPMHIVVADSHSVTVASDDGRAVYTFDIATRQWVPNPPSVLLTASPHPVGTNTPNGKDDFNTRLAQHMAAIATEVALTPKSPYTPIILQTRSPLPATPTWPKGFGSGIMAENSFNPFYLNCWYGRLRDKLLQLCAGHEQFGGDPKQGVLMIRIFEQDQDTVVSKDVYETPDKVGAVHIVQADGNSVTVATDDEQIDFTFDIATRQWVPNPPSVLSTTSP